MPMKCFSIFSGTLACNDYCDYIKQLDAHTDVMNKNRIIWKLHLPFACFFDLAHYLISACTCYSCCMASCTNVIVHCFGQCDPHCAQEQVSGFPGCPF